MIDPKNVRDSLDDYRDEEFPDDYVDPRGCCWHTAREMLVNSEAILGLCGCGIGGDFDYILRGLELIDARAPDFGPDRSAWDVWWKAHREKEAALFGNDNSAQFFYKWADREGLAEHGSSVPGWLTDTGKSLLALMREAKKREPAEPEAS